MDNTIPFNPTSCTVRTEQITVDVSILSVLNHAASPGRHKPDANIYLAAIAPDMELTIIMEEDAPHILPCFDEEDATITMLSMGIRSLSAYIRKMALDGW